ncbi:hypothetical protein Agub_g14616, partial [Astrephomene gubernaculifera]
GGHHHGGQHGGNPLRKYSLFLGLALVFALLPTVLVMHSRVDQCKTILERLGREQRGFSANPFSHYNLCKIRLRLAGLTAEARQNAREHPRSSSTGGVTSGSSSSSGGVNATQASKDPQQSQGQGQAAKQDAGGQLAGAKIAPQPPPSPSPPPPSPPPPPPSPPPPAPPPPAPPPPSPPPPSPAPSPPPPSPPPPSPPPPSPAASQQQQQTQQQQQQQPQPQQQGGSSSTGTKATSGRAAFHEYDVSKLISTEVSATATDVHSDKEDWSDFDLPKTQADVDRLMTLPHVDECYYCKVCIPNSALRLKQPGQQQQQQQQSQQAAAAKTTRRRLLSAQERASEAYRANPAEAEGLIYGLKPLEGPFSAHGFSSGGGSDSGCNNGACGGSRSSSSSSFHSRKLSEYHGAPEQEEEDVTAEQAAAEAELYDNGSSSQQQQLHRHGRRLAEEEKYQALDTTESGPDYHIGGRIYNISNIAPGRRIFQSKSHLPNCTLCRGCDHTLEMMASGSILLGSYYAHEPGGSPSWLFRVRTDRTASGWAVVKVWCIPVLKPKQRGLGMCDPKKVYAQVKLLLAQQKLTAECGMNEIVPKVWVEPLNGVMPGSGFHVKWLGLWADIADGVSVQNIQEAGKPPLQPELLVELLSKRINHHELVQGAIFDLLFSQCDRHQQNIFLTETGKFWLIDNDQVYATAWRRCGIDSLLVPTTQKFMINHLGFFYVLKYPQKNPPRGPAKFLSPLLLMDYRCHAEGGSIGKKFTPELTECLSHISSMSSPDIQEQYGYPVLRMADAVRNRSRDLLAHGYEWTLLYGQPTNQAMHRYKIAPKCCDMHFNRSVSNYVCDTPGWRQMTEIPYGNAWHGGVWHGTKGLDTGSYVGGTSFLPEWWTSADEDK